MREFWIRPFTLLDKKWQRITLICTGLIFGIFFMNVFVPFNVNRWVNDSGFQQFLRLSSFGVIAAMVLTVTQFGIRPVFKLKSLNRFQFAIFVVLELMLIALLFTIFHAEIHDAVWKEYLMTLRYTSLGIFTPYLIALLLIGTITPRKEIKEVTVPSKVGLIGIPDEKGVVKLSVQLEDLLYMESTDNYATIFFADEGNVKKMLVRNTLKNLEQELNEFPILRCHRSFIVNVNNIKMAQKTSGKFLLHLKNCDTIIPVSRKYIPQFQQHL
ncbi:LytTR family transcriptional regulator [Prolixibacteraceae bacterium JC049]|nr:LytTR family transcriptional regulator [Prolixibacteraceae bacterium JC049]